MNILAVVLLALAVWFLLLGILIGYLLGRHRRREEDDWIEWARRLREPDE